MYRTDSHNRQQLLFRWIAVMAGVIVFLSGTVTWQWYTRPTPITQPTGIILESARDGRNIVREAFPHVDFTPLYPGMTEEEIDQVQRETFAVRYVYSPFVQFRGLPMQTRYVTVAPDGRRLPGHAQPWPPRSEDVSVFVFGGSTVFGHNLPPEQTVPVALEQELRRRFPGTEVHVYNFGCGYYFSSQERVLFNQLLENGVIPDFAVFIDGLNDFLNPLGIPEYTRTFLQYTLAESELPPEPRYEAEDERRVAVHHLLRRYQSNVRLISGSAQHYGVQTIFVGQPVPFLSYPRNPVTYPFAIEREIDVLCRWGYSMFAAMAEQKAFGSRFLWLGDVFAEAAASMYSDSVHYSPAGARRLAQQIVERAGQAKLLNLGGNILRSVTPQKPPPAPIPPKPPS